jgi:hypothetical protein
MQALAIPFAKLGAGLLGSTAAAGATTASLASTGAGLLSTGVGIVGNFMANRYQQGILAQQAAIERRNAEMTRDAGRKSAQDADIVAADAISEEVARQAASGFSIGSPSYLRRIMRTRALAGLNRERIVDDADRQATSSLNRAAAADAEANQSKRAGYFNLIAGGLNLGSDLLSGSTLLERSKQKRITASY